MEPQEFQIDEADIRDLIDRLTRTGVPHDLQTLTEWYIEILTQRVTAG